MAANRKERWVGGMLIAALIVLAAVGQWRITVQRGQALVARVRYPRGVMGTETALVVVHAREDVAGAESCLRAAEAELRQVEARMSNWLEESEVSRLCAAEAGVELGLSDATREVLQAARAAHTETEGAFDVTCHPQLELWRRAAGENRYPKAGEVTAARRQSNWDLMELTAHGYRKAVRTAGVDLGGIAKGYAIDRALRALQSGQASGGLVDVGGDLACFGSQPDGRPWLVDVQDPAGDRAFARLRIRGGAVATSGDYARYYEINGNRYSQIIDPRSGYPAAATRSVTVVAPSALTADVWATALSVLGESGFARLPEGVDALLVVAGESGPRFVCTPGFLADLEPPVPQELECRPATASGGP